ncbi:hypothetical protein [Thermotomaculum hydrothermale]|uniref:hypothetical protein n=1 Tax=Thermotomaculum hydrothermale TaxID=981385 RepID=UPI001916736B|nr:hypothetical protein [Thermotomaculum hydrothermale]
MHPLKLVLVGLSLLLFYHAFNGVKKGTIYVKGGYVNRYESPFWFWVNVISVVIVGIVLLVYSFIAKVQG